MIDGKEYYKTRPIIGIFRNKTLVYNLGHLLLKFYTTQTKVLGDHKNDVICVAAKECITQNNTIERNNDAI